MGRDGIPHLAGNSYSSRLGGKCRVLRSAPASLNDTFDYRSEAKRAVGHVVGVFLEQMRNSERELEESQKYNITFFTFFQWKK